MFKIQTYITYFLCTSYLWSIQTYVHIYVFMGTGKIHNKGEFLDSEHEKCTILRVFRKSCYNSFSKDISSNAHLSERAKQKKGIFALIFSTLIDIFKLLEKSLSLIFVTVVLALVLHMWHVIFIFKVVFPSKCFNVSCIVFFLIYIMLFYFVCLDCVLSFPCRHM